MEHRPAAEDGRRECRACRSITDDTGRVLCLDCNRPAEDGQKRRCLTHARQAGGAA